MARAVGITSIVVTDDTDADAARLAGFIDIAIGRSAAAGTAANAASAYGLAPGSRPVMSVEGEVVAVKHVAEGEGVSYGYTYRTREPTSLALVGLGYSDGIPRLASNRAEALLSGCRRPVVGRIAMDQLVLDCGSDDPVAGDIVTLFGDPARGEPSASEWAAWTERSALELTAGLGVRILREAR